MSCVRCGCDGTDDSAGLCMCCCSPGEEAIRKTRTAAAEAARRNPEVSDQLATLIRERDTARAEAARLTKERVESEALIDAAWAELRRHGFANVTELLDAWRTTESWLRCFADRDTGFAELRGRCAEAEARAVQAATDISALQAERDEARERAARWGEAFSRETNLHLFTKAALDQARADGWGAIAWAQECMYSLRGALDAACRDEIAARRERDELRALLVEEQEARHAAANRAIAAQAEVERLKADLAGVRAPAEDAADGGRMSNERCGVPTLVFRPGEPQQLLPCARRPHKGRHSTDPWLAPRLDAAESDDNAAWAQCDFERTVVTRERDEARAEVERLKERNGDASDLLCTGAVAAREREAAQDEIAGLQAELDRRGQQWAQSCVERERLKVKLKAAAHEVIALKTECDTAVKEADEEQQAAKRAAHERAEAVAEVVRLKAELSDAIDGANTGAVESGIAYRRLEQGCSDLHAYAVRLYRAGVEWSASIGVSAEVDAVLLAAPESVKVAAEDAARGAP